MRGWGASVPLLFVFWVFAVIAFAVIAAPYQPDTHKADLDVQWLFTAMFALYALSVYALVRLRRRNPPQEADEFLFLRLEIWPVALFDIAAVLGVSAWLGYPFFHR